MKAERKLSELSAKLASVGRELAEWKEQSEEGGPLEKHHTQVRAVATALETLAQGIEARLAAAATGTAVLARAVSVELMILELHRIWEFFRSKLALRYVPWFRSYLLAADEFAWSCYRPAHNWVSAGRAKEPPLVFFTGGSSPLTLPRGSAYVAEDVPGEALRTQQFQAMLRHLPIPVIGVPWFQLQHLPDAPVIGHEVGHDVEADLGLTPRMHELLDEALTASGADAHRAAWHAWLGEVFADVYGALATGPAYVATLADFLVGDVREVARETPRGPDWGAYPPRALRVLLAAEVVAGCGLPDEARDLGKQWRDTYGEHAAPEFERDLPVVVKALVAGPYEELGGGGLTTLVKFGASEQLQATRAASEATAGRSPDVDDVRVLTAAARLAFDADPQAYGRKDAAQRILRRIEKAQASGTRAQVAAGNRPTLSGRARDERDAAVGEHLFALVSEAHEIADI
jgi:hypothetical protein